MCGSRAAGMILKYTSLMVGKPGNTAEVEYFSFQVAIASEIPINLAALSKDNSVGGLGEQPLGAYLKYFN